MLEIHLAADGLDSIISEIEHLRDGILNLRPVAEAVAEAVTQEVIAARLAGVDKDGEELAPIGAPPANPANRQRTLRSRKGGPVLADSGTSARTITQFRHAVERVAGTEWVIKFGWLVPWVEYHARGEGRYGPIAVRDIGGLSPEAWVRVAAVFREAVAQHIEGR